MLARYRHLLRCALLFFSLCVGMCISLWYHLPSFAASTTHHAITVLTENATVAFPTAITFQVRVQDSTGPITQATLLLSTDMPNSSLESHTVTFQTIGAITTASYQESITNSNFVIPGTHISYYWALQDANGSSYLPNEQITVTDTRFQWQELSQGLVHLHWYKQSMTTGQAYLAKAVASVARISLSLGSGLRTPINLWIYQSHADLLTALSPQIHEWVGGIAFPIWNESFIVADSINDLTMVRDMPHELTHLIFHQITSLYMDIPTWFDEGLAMYNQPYHEPDLTQVFTAAVSTNALLPFASLTNGFPADADQAYLAYAQSWKLMTYMYTTFGQRKMVTFIASMNTPERSFDEDMQQALGVDSSQLEKRWQLSLSSSSPVASTPQHITQTSLSDPNAPLYLSVGILLILLPIVGGILLFFFIRRGNARTQSVAYAVAVEKTLLPHVHPTEDSPYDAILRYENTVQAGRPLTEQWIPEHVDHLTGEATDIYGMYQQE